MKGEGKNSKQMVVVEDDDDFVQPPCLSYIKPEMQKQKNPNPIIDNYVNYHNERLSNLNIGGDRSSSDPFVIADPLQSVDIDANGEKSVLSTRMSPHSMSIAIQNMSTFQKQDVKNMGFGGFLEMKISQLPLKLAHFIVENFIADNMVIELKNGNIQLSTHVFSNMFGIPGVGENVEDVIPVKSDDWRLLSWKAQYPDKKYNNGNFVAKIKESKEGGFLFQLNFLMLFINTFAETELSGSCKVHLVEKLVAMEDFSRVNWCSYIFDCLEKSKTKWKKNNKHSFYPGPLQFLMLAYVDAVVCDKLNLERKRPFISECTHDHLKTLVDHEMTIGEYGTLPIRKDYQFPDNGPEYRESRVEFDSVQRFNSKLEDIYLRISDDKRLMRETLLDGLLTYPIDFIMREWTYKAEELFNGDCFTELRKSVEVIEDKMKRGKAVRVEAVVEDDMETDRNERSNSCIIILGCKGGTSGVKKEVKDVDTHMQTPIKTTTLANEYVDVVDLEWTPTFVKELEDSEEKYLRSKRKVQFDLSDVPSFNLMEKTPTNQCKRLKTSKTSYAINTTVGVHAALKDPNGVVDMLMKRTTKPGKLKCSPYVKRITDLNEKIDPKDTLVHQTLMGSMKAESDIIWRTRDGHELNLRRTKQLAWMGAIDSAVVDAWSAFLNRNEIYRDKDSYYRMFFATDILDEFIMDLSKDPENRYQMFVNNIRVQVTEMSDEDDLNEFDLIFFPFMHDGMYYLICMNFRRNLMLVIDTKKQDGLDDMTVNLRINILQEFTNRYLKETGKVFSDDLMLTTPTFINKKGQTPNYENNSGVILMRNMESYMGETVAGWNSGIMTDSKRHSTLIHKLRQKYVTRMMLSQFDECKADFEKEMAIFSSLDHETKIKRTNEGGRRLFDD